MASIATSRRSIATLNTVARTPFPRGCSDAAKTCHGGFSAIADRRGAAVSAAGPRLFSTLMAAAAASDPSSNAVPLFLRASPFSTAVGLPAASPANPAPCLPPLGGGIAPCTFPAHASQMDLDLGPEPFTTVHGEQIHNLHIRVDWHGSPTASRTVVIFPSFSHSSHVASSLSDPSPGWWQDMVGSGKPIDTRHFRILCLSFLGSPHGATNPTSLDSQGKQWRARFPQLTPTDLAICHKRVLDRLGISGQLHAVIGSSFGGMQALQFASLFPERVKKLVAIACTGKTTPFTVGIRSLQRECIRGDPGWRGGDYADKPASAAAGLPSGPWEGLKLARQVGTLFYRSREEFDSRFSWDPREDLGGTDRAAGAASLSGPACSIHFSRADTFEVEQYLAYQGSKFSRGRGSSPAYDPNCYLLLSKCMDLMDLGDGVEGRDSFAEGVGRIAADCLFVPIKEDLLIPARELQGLAETLASSRGKAQGMGTAAEGADASRAAAAGGAAAGASGKVVCDTLSSLYGHDAFLKEPAWLGPRLRGFLEEGIEQELEGERVHNTLENAP